MDQLTDNEREIIKYVRSMRAFERVEVHADKNGKPNQFILFQSSKVILDDDGPKPTR